MSTFTTQDGFTWYIVQPHVAKYLHNDCEVYKIYDDESEALCEEGYNFMCDDSERYAIEHPSQRVVYAICGADAVRAYENKDYQLCYDIVFNQRRGDIAFFSPIAKPKDVINALRICGAVTYISSDDFLKIITNG